MSKIVLEAVNLPEVREAIAKRPELARAVLDAAVEAAAEVIQQAAAADAPGPGIEINQTGEGVYEVGPAAAKFYYLYFETGTNPHMVRPRTARALAWGGDRFSAGHVVGGVTAEPFLRPAVDQNGDKAGAAAGEVWKKAIE